MLCLFVLFSVNSDNSLFDNIIMARFLEMLLLASKPMEIYFSARVLT